MNSTIYNRTQKDEAPSVLFGLVVLDYCHSFSDLRSTATRRGGAGPSRAHPPPAKRGSVPLERTDATSASLPFHAHIDFGLHNSRAVGRRRGGPNDARVTLPAVGAGRVRRPWRGRRGKRRAPAKDLGADCCPQRAVRPHRLSRREKIATPPYPQLRFSRDGGVRGAAVLV